jgi:predicted ATP-grasp superfamily ATP-dependent carboligase
MLNFGAPHVLICGTSTRAAAESAARAGFAVTSIDGYADLDQHPSVRALSLPRDFHKPVTPHAAACASRCIACDAVVYLSAFENHPRAVQRLADGRRLWGNSSDVLSRVRNPVLVAAALRARGFPVPEVAVSRDISSRHVAREWMIKPFRSGGGRGVQRWTGAVRRDSYLQQRIDGVPASVVFVASGRKAVALAISRQLIGDEAFGAGDYRYCGSIAGPAAIDEAGAQMVAERVCRLANAVADEFELMGVNGIDLIVRDGVPYPIEVNPRWSSSMELVERACGVSVFSAHAAACARSELPPFDVIEAIGSTRSTGKAIVFARHHVIAGATEQWLADRTIRDIPRPGEPILAGQPVCTVFAEAGDASGCYAALVRKAEHIYAQLESWR